MSTPSEPIPARMLNEIAYCPRLYAIEHILGDFADSTDTIEGRTVHRKVDKPTTATLPEPGEAEDPDRPRAVRSVHLSDPGLGMVAVIDLVEVDGDRVVPVDYKKSAAPNVPEGAWEPERVQVCAQALLLRAHGYHVDHAILYFAGSKKRVRIEISDELVTRTLQCRDEARRLLETQELPPPLVASRKCVGCSLVGICLPDEHHTLTTPEAGPVRALTPARDDTIPLHVKLVGGRIGLSGGEIHATDRDGQSVAKVRLQETSQVVVHGNVTVTTPLLHELAQRDIPLALHSYGGWYQGTLHPASGRNVLLRHRQHLAAADPARTLAIAKGFVGAKIRNQRTLLRRNGKETQAALAILQDAIEQAPKAPDLDTLRGIEGYAARAYFEKLPSMLDDRVGSAFAFDGRNRRPPRDPVNAMLSFVYAMLARELSHAAYNVGLDPYIGFLHTMRPNRPALALDLMEELRPVIGDSVVLNVVNNGVLKPDDFVITPVGCTLRDAGKKRFIQTYERRLDELVTHPRFGVRWSYRRLLEVQARLLGKAILGEIDEYPGFTVR